MRYTCLLLITVLVGCLPAAETVVKVPEDYATLAEAVAAAPDGAVIELGPGVHETPIELADGRSLTIRGKSAEETVIDAGGSGRAILVSAGGDVVLESMTLKGGDADLGGGIKASGATSLTVRDCRIVGNSAFKGGGIHVSGVETVTIERTTIEGNSAVGQGASGGAIYIADAGAVEIERCEITGNTAEMTGAISLFTARSARIVNCLIAGNHTTKSFGTLNLVGAAKLTLANLTLADNVIDTTEDPSSVEIVVKKSESVSAGNLILSGKAVYGLYAFSTTTFTVGSSIVSGYTLKVAGAAKSGSGLLDGDPGFLGSGDYHLAPTSPAIDAGDAALAPIDDLDGKTRTTPDIGAYEG